MMNQVKYPPPILIDDKTDLNVFARESIASFCVNYDINQSRHLLWQLLKTGLVNKDSLLTAHERSNLLSFYENLNELLFAVSFINGIRNV